MKTPLNTIESLETFWQALPDASLSYWSTELSAIRTTLDKVAEMEQRVKELRDIATQEINTLSTMMLRASHEWPIADVKAALQEAQS